MLTTDWIGLALALVVGGWLTYDGGHAFLKGDYVTPKSGARAGQLGPWSRLVAAAGIAPRSTLMKSIHLVLGLVWIAVMIAFVLGTSWSRGAMIACAGLSLWYLPFGTLLGIVQVVLFLLPVFRGSG